MPCLLSCIVLGGRQREEAGVGVKGLGGGGGRGNGCRLLVSAWSSGFPRMASD